MNMVVVVLVTVGCPGVRFDVNAHFFEEGFGDFSPLSGLAAAI